MDFSMILIDERTLDTFRQKTVCEYCGRHCPQGLDPHHVFSRGHGGGTRLDHPYNLIALCRGFQNGAWISCHQRAQAGQITRREILAIVAARERLTPEDLLAFLIELRDQ
jgi:hypothetical protein